MSRTGIKNIVVSPQQMEEVAALLGVDVRNSRVAEAIRNDDGRNLEAKGLSMMEIEKVHLTDEQFVGFSLNTLTPALTGGIERHLTVCAACAAEVTRMKGLSTFWADQAAIDGLTTRVRLSFILRGAGLILGAPDLSPL